MYFLKTDNDHNIIFLGTFKLDEDCIEVTPETYEKAKRYSKYNYLTKEFQELKRDYSLEYIKQEKIDKSKEELQTWLANNPLFSTVHNQNGEYYNVTQEKQTQLTQMLTLAQLAQQVGTPFITTWNASGGICEEWTIEELTALTFQITQYVLPRVKKQQHYEVQINKAISVEEVGAIVFDYETV